MIMSPGGKTPIFVFIYNAYCTFKNHKSHAIHFYSTTGIRFKGRLRNPLGFPPASRDIRDLGWILGWEDSLEVGMATHSGIVAWKIRNRGAWRATIHSPGESDMTEVTSRACRTDRLTLPGKS